MKRLGVLLGLGALGGLVSIGVPGLLAQPTSPLAGFCPDISAQQRCAMAAQIYLSQTNPSDNQAVVLITGIADATRAATLPRGVCADSVEGIRLIALSVESASLRTQIADLAESLCRGEQQSATTGTTGYSSLSLPVVAAPNTSSSSSGGSSGTTSGGSSGTSGEGSSGTSGGSSGTSGEGSSGTSGNGSSGTSGEGSSGTSGEAQRYQWRWFQRHQRRRLQWYQR